MRLSWLVLGVVLLSIGCGAAEDPKRGTYIDTSDPSKTQAPGGSGTTP